MFGRWDVASGLSLAVWSSRCGFLDDFVSLVVGTWLSGHIWAFGGWSAASWLVWGVVSWSSFGVWWLGRGLLVGLGFRFLWS